MWHACKDEKKSVIGVQTTEEVKINMVNTARAMMQENKIRVLRDLACAGKRKGLKNLEKSSSARNLLAEQLKRLQQKIKPAKDVFGTSKAKISGKMGSYQDDIAIAFLLGVHWTLKHTFGGGIPIVKS